MPRVPVFPFERREVAGVIVVNLFAILSTIAVLGVAVRLAWLLFLRFCRRIEVKSKECVFFNTQLGYYAACLLISNAITSVAGVMGLSFVSGGAIREDGLCTTQAVTMQIGNLSTAYFTTAIAIHTFNSLVMKRRQSAPVYTTAIVVGWIFSGTLGTLPLYLPTFAGPIYGASGLSCGVRGVYPTHLFLLHLLPIFLSALISAILYSLIYLVLRGTLVIKGGIKLHLDPNERGSTRLGGYQRFVAGIARSMLWFPAAYILFLVPYSVTRLLVLSGFSVPFEAVVFAFTCWFTLGVANVILLYNTFRVLEPAFDGRSGSSKDAESGRTQSEKVDSFVSREKQPRLDRLHVPGARATEIIGYYTQSAVAYPLPVASPTSASLGRASPISPVQAPYHAPRFGSISSTGSHSRDGSTDSLLRRPSPAQSSPLSSRQPQFDFVSPIAPLERQWEVPQSPGRYSPSRSPTGPRPLTRGLGSPSSSPLSQGSMLATSPPRSAYI